MSSHTFGLGWLFAGLAFGSAFAAEPTGYVLSVDAHEIWSATATPTTPPVAKLVAGMAVYGGSRLECKPCTPKSKLTLAFLDGSADGVPPGYMVQPTHDAPRSDLSRLVSAVAQSLSQPKRVLVFGISRGAKDLVPAVLKLTDRRVDMAPSMSGLDAGEYELEFTPVDGGPALDAKCHFDPPSRSSATAAPSPGAYTLRVSSASGTPRGGTTVLVVPAADFDARAEEFHKAVELTASWPVGAGPQARETFLAALLVAMAPVSVQ